MSCWSAKLLKCAPRGGARPGAQAAVRLKVLLVLRQMPGAPAGKQVQQLLGGKATGEGQGTRRGVEEQGV